MSGPFYKIYHPEVFQGNLSRKKYFEGWYYKLVSAGQEQAIAIIPGISVFNQDDRHAFIQTFNGKDNTSNYHRFSLDEFKAEKGILEISIGNNRFTKNLIHLDLPEMKGEITFSNMIQPSSTRFSPGVMGWYSFVPGMQCYHGIVSLHHELSGFTTGNFGSINWDNGSGYIEKDWGSSFPACWIWIHCNHFKEASPVSLMASVAHIPWMGRYFPGFITVFWLEGKEYRFASYNHSRMKCHVSKDIVHLDFQRKDVELSITAHRTETASLHTPQQGQMIGKLNESLSSHIEVNLSKAGKKIWFSEGSTAGLDVSGDTSILETTTWRK